MIQTNFEKNPPFLISKEKNIHLLTKRAERTKRINNSLNNLNIIKINSYNNFDLNRKNGNIESKREETNSSSTEPGIKFNVGRWTKEEHKNFLKGMKIYGNNWKMVQGIIKTRSSAQTRSHAQKYFVRIKKIIKRKYKKFNAKSLINYVFNEIKKINGGYITTNDKKRGLNVIISNFQNFRKEEIGSCNMIVNETKVKNSQEDGDNSTFCEKECNKNIVSEKNDIIIEINEFKSNSNIEDKPNEQENKMEFCNKKRKNSSLVNKTFQINKVVKYKYFNKINENSNRQNFGKLTIKRTKNKSKSKNKFDDNIICPIISESYNINNNINNSRNNLNNNLLCNISVNNDMNTMNINFSNKDNMNSFTNNNFNTNINNNINDFTYMDMNKINFSEPLFDFGSSIRKINYFDKFVDEVDFNDSLKSILLEDNNISLGEQDNYFPIIN